MSEHPSRKQLGEWANGRREELTSHIDSCEQCQVSLEDLTALPARARDALASITTPRRGLLERLEQRLEMRRARLEELTTLGDLFGLGWRTLDLMVDEDE